MTQWCNGRVLVKILIYSYFLIVTNFEKFGVPVLRPTVIWPIGTLAHYNLALSNVALCNLALL